MTYINGIGSPQNYRWIKHEPSVQKSLDAAQACFEDGRFDEMHGVLDPLIKQGNPEALFLAANVSRRDESEGEFERRHLEFIKQSATAEYPPALYTLGFYYDMGDAAPVIPHDPLKAAQIFKRGAELKHAHCQHLHAEALLYGAHGIEKDVDAGMAYLRESAEAKFEGSLKLLAEYYEKGEFGLPIDLQKAASLRAEAESEDVVGY